MTIFIIILLAVVVLAAVISGIYITSKTMLNNAIKGAKPDYMSVTRLRNNLCRGNAKTLLIDVREKWEYERGHIYAANNIPIKELAGRLDDLDKDMYYVLICDNTKRSILASMMMTEEGYKANVLEGGLRAWTEAGLKLESGKMKISEEDIKAQA